MFIDEPRERGINREENNSVFTKGFGHSQLIILVLQPMIYFLKLIEDNSVDK